MGTQFVPNLLAAVAARVAYSYPKGVRHSHFPLVVGAIRSVSFAK